MQPTERVSALPNSTYLVQTRVGPILVNCPPETLKMLLDMGIEPPKIILLSPDVPAGQMLGASGFVRQGINYASIEFLAYANYFGQDGRQTLIITPTHQQVERLRVILRETVIGPTNPLDFGPDTWLREECDAVGYLPPLGRALQPEDLARLASLDHGGGNLGQGVTISLDGDEFVFREYGITVARVPTHIKGIPRPLRMAPARPLNRHELTLLFIGGSDGFDPAGITTCFLAYLGRSVQTQATLFDTAAYMRFRLGSLGLSSRQISEIVLSHLHEDHLAGLPELLLMGHQRLRLLTADIIYTSLLRVLSAILNQPEEEIAALFDYIPLNPGHPIELEGRRFESLYAVHTIPTIAVRAADLYYSGDMLYDEAWFNYLVDTQVLTPKRRDELLHFAEGAKVLVQDAGGGSIHTTVTPELLQSLAAKGQKVILAHTNQQDLPIALNGSDMGGRVEIASSGHISLIGEQLSDMEEIERLETFSANPLFARLPMQERIYLAQEAPLLDWTDGETILRHGDPADGWLYIVHSGVVEIWSDTDLIKTVGRGSTIGERGALLGESRFRSVIAHGRVQLFGLNDDLFRPVAEQLGLDDALERADWLWRHPFFRELNWGSLLDLALDFEPRQYAGGSQLFHYTEPGVEGFLLVEGQIQLLDKNDQLIEDINAPGAFVGARAALQHSLHLTTARTVGSTTVWTLPSAALHRLQMIYPTLLFHMRAVDQQRLR